MSMEVRTNLLIKFAQLGGKTLKEHNEQFGELCRELRELRTRRALMIIRSFISMHTSTLQEYFLHAKLLIMFRDFHSLLKMSFGTNKLINRKIIRNKPYIKFVSGIDVNCFVDEVCMKVSYVNRLYMTRKISHMVNCPDEFFFRILAAYGFESAKPFLPYSKMDVIELFVAERKPTFNDKSLLHIHHRDENFLKMYFTLTKDKLRKKLCIALCKDNVLVKLDKELIFGKRSFRHFYTRNRIYVLTNSLKFVKFAKIIRHRYGIEDYKLFLYNMLPRYEDEFKMTKEIIQTILPLRKNMRYNVFTEVYMTRYKKDYVDANYDFIKIITSEDRLKLNIGLKIEYFLIPESLRCFRDNKNISLQTIKHMIICCKLNNCTDTLLEVMTIFNQLFLYKEDECMVEFLKCLKIIPVQDLGDRHWHYINMFLSQVNKFSLYDLPIFLYYFKNYAIFLFGEDIKCDDVLNSILRYSIASDDLRIFKGHEHLERHFLTVAPRIIDSLRNVDIDQLKLKYYYTLYLYNIDNKNNQITLCTLPSWFPNYLRKLVNPDSKCIYKVYHIIIELWKQENGNNNFMEYRREVLAAYFNNMNCMISENLLLWFLNEKPIVIEDFIDIIITKTQPYLTFYNFYYQLNKMSWLGLSNKLSVKCMAICNANHLILGRGVFQFLSYSAHYVIATRAFDPTVCDLTMYSKKVLHECHRSLLLSGNKFVYPEIAVAFLIKFSSFQLKYFTPAFYTLMYHSPYEFVTNALSVILKGSNVNPAWKYAIYLTGKLLNQKLFVEYISKHINKEPDYRIFNWIFRKAIKQLAQNCEESTINIISKSTHYYEMDGISELKQLKKIPIYLYCKFIQIIWRKNDRTEIIKYINSEAISNFPSDFNDKCLIVALENSNVDYIYNYCAASEKNMNYIIAIVPHVSLMQKIVSRIVKERNFLLATQLTDSKMRLTYSITIQLVLLQKYIKQDKPFFVELLDYHESLFTDYGPELMPSYRKIMREMIVELGIDQMQLAEDIANYNNQEIRIKLLALDVLPLVKHNDTQFKSRLGRILMFIQRNSNDLVRASSNLYLSNIE